MPIYFHPTRKYYLLNSLKVMSSTLNRQADLRKAGRLAFVVNNFRKNTPQLSAHPQYLLVRDPYRRVESFFRDKLRRDLKKWVKRKKDLRNCHRIFYRLAGVDAHADTLDEIKEKLHGISFDTFIRNLPRLYLQDGHLYPQHQLVEKKILGLVSLSFSYDRILQLEVKEDMKYLESELGLQLGRKYNATRKYAEETRWNDELARIVYGVYEVDFLAFGYRKEFEEPNP